MVSKNEEVGRDGAQERDGGPVRRETTVARDQQRAAGTADPGGDRAPEGRHDPDGRHDGARDAAGGPEVGRRPAGDPPAVAGAATGPGPDAAGHGAPGESVAKDRAAAVVLAYRAVDWEQVVDGDADAVAGLVSACEQHESARMFLESQEGAAAPLAKQLAKGLERFYGEHVAPRLRHQKVIRQMLAVAEPPSMAGPGTEPLVEDGMAPRRRPPVTVGHTMRVNTGCGNLYVTVNEDETGRPFELFNHMGKAGGCAASQNEAIGRLISYALRCGASIEPLIKQLKGISCHRPAWGEDGKISSCADGIGKALEKYWVALQGRLGLPSPGGEPAAVGRKRARSDDNGGERRGAGVESTSALASERRHLAQALAAAGAGAPQAPVSREAGVVQGACRDCGSQLAYEEGCVKCYSCGFTECG